MSTIKVTTIAAAIAALALSAIPVSAQDGRRGNGDEQSQSRAERRRPRADTGGQRGERRQPRAERGARNDDSQRAAPRRQAVPRDSVEARRGGRDGGQRVVPQRNPRDTGRYDGRRDGARYNGGVYRPAPRVTRGYSRPSRVYVVPYGYRPRGYRAGWNSNLYFGSPYGYGPGYGSRGYYNRGAYGYYPLPQGFAYGSLRIVDAPRHAPVFVDGYYAGEVDDYDGIFQRLNLAPGGHQIEIEAYPGAPPMTFDVYIEPGRTVTIHARP